MRCGKGHGSGAGECSIASPAAGGNRGGTGNGERGTVGSRAVPVPRFFALLAALVLAACKEEGGELPILKRIPLPEPVSATATLTTDSAGRVWVGDAGRLTVLDTLGRVAARIPVAGAPARVLRMRGSRLYVTRGPRDLAVVDAGTGRILAERRARRAGPVVIDPMARWAFTTGRWGGVLGMDTLLVTRWGWPEAGSEAGALAISPLGDRVYLAVNGDDDRSPAVQVRDAYSGRVLSSWEPPAPVRGLEAASDGRLYGWDDDGVFALRHVAGGLAEVWRVSPGLERIEALRVSPSGARVAVLARGEGGGVRVLDTADGRVVAREGEAPPDAAWDVRGRLLVLGTREVRVVR